MGILGDIAKKAEALHKEIEAQEAQKSEQEKAKDELYRFMHSISEGYACTGWVHDLEFKLWEMAQNLIPFPLISKRLAPYLAGYLKELANAANGWWIWDDQILDKKFIDLDQWKEIYDKKSKSI
jgi:hypothetical protein